MSKLKLYLEWGITTFFGTLMEKKFCKMWDSKLNQLMNKYEGVLCHTDCTITFNKTEVWVGNRFYAYGHLNASFSDYKEFRPKVSTMLRLASIHDALKKKKEDRRREIYLNTLDKIE